VSETKDGVRVIVIGYGRSAEDQRKIADRALTSPRGAKIEAIPKERSE
jgi:hypothetical protein